MEIINIEQLEKLPEMLKSLNEARINEINEALKIRDNRISIYKEQIEDLNEKIRLINIIPLKELSICPVCNDLYDRRRGKTCCVSCYIDKYL